MKKLIFCLLILPFSLSLWAVYPKDYYAKKAEEALVSGEFEDALDYARQEIHDYENNPGGYLMASHALYALNSPGQALSMAEKAIEKSKKDKGILSDSYKMKSVILMELGDTLKAVKTLEEGLKSDSRNFDLIMDYVSIIDTKQPEKALKYIEKAKKIDPSNPNPYFYAAYCFMNMEEPQKALDEVNKALRLDDKNAYAYFQRGSILRSLDRSPEWIQDYLRSIDIDINGSPASLLLAYTQENPERESIIKEIEKTWQAGDANYGLKAHLLYSWEYFPESAMAYMELIEAGMGDATAYYALSVSLDKMNRLLESYDAASRGLRLFPESNDLKFQKAKLGVKTGHPKEAIEILDLLILKDPENAVYYEEKGKALMSEGQYEKAVEPFHTALILYPTPSSRNFYADALRLSGQTDKAVKEYQEILKIPAEVMVEEGYYPEVWYAMAYSALGNAEMAKQEIDKLSQNGLSPELEILPLIYARANRIPEALEVLNKKSEEDSWVPILDFYNYNYHILQSNPGFADIFSKKDIATEINPSTGLLQLAFNRPLDTMGGTSYEEAMNLMASNPQEWVKKMNALCPFDMGLLGQLTSVGYDEKSKTLIYNYLVTSRAGYFFSEGDNPEFIHDLERMCALLLLTSSQNPDYSNLDYQVKYNLTSATNGEKISLLMTSQLLREMEKVAQNQEESDSIILNFWILQDKYLLDNSLGIEGSKVYREGNWYVIEMPLSNDSGYFSQMELFQQEIKKNLARSFSDMTFQPKLPIYIRNNIGLKYVYVNQENGDKVSLDFTPEELRQYLIVQ